jgi:hypothetical protein
VQTFDAEVYPQAQKRLGQVLDVDRDGRFTILFTNRINKLGSGGSRLDGFVRGSDFYRDLEAPFGNQCDMMYLSAELKPGPYLRTLLAHEYTHAVVFSEHVFGDYLPDHTKDDEQAWLNEALAHINEDQHGYSWSNLDYRVGAYLADPGRYSLVVPDYYRAKLWRSPGHRGATYLFLRWCVDHYGPDLVRRLVQSNLAGVNNLEAATGERFDDLFRQWSVAQLLSGTNLALADFTPFRRLDLHKDLGDQSLAGPRTEPIGMANEQRALTVAGTSLAYVLLHSPAGDKTRLTVIGEAGMDLQVSLLRLPSGMGRLSARVEHSAKETHLVITAHDTAMTLDTVGIDARPPKDTKALGIGPTSHNRPLKEGESVQTEAFLTPAPRVGQEKVVFRVTATDERGHHLATWVER